MIRAAVLSDAAAIAGVEVRAWHRAHTDWAEAEAFPTLGERVVRWESQLGGDATTLVFAIGGTVAGFAAVGPGRDDDLDRDVGELIALYVDPAAQGAGVGGSLLAEAVVLMRDEGYTGAVLWVFAENAHARQVYEQRGWLLDAGAVRDALWAPEVRYRRTL